MLRLSRRTLLIGALTLLLGLGIVPLAPPAAGLSAQETGETPAQPLNTGWVCGLVVDESFGFVTDAEVALYPHNADSGDPVTQTTSEEHGTFCLQDLQPGFYQLRISKAPWPPQPPRVAEVRAGKVNRMGPIELEREPGDPQVSYRESFDGMQPGEARAVAERLLANGDVDSIKELARRLLPKRGVALDVNRVMPPRDPKPLLEELMKEIDRGYLPPIKTARYVFLVGELADPRTRQAASALLMQKLRDGRLLPAAMAGTFGDGETAYVSDVAVHALIRLAEGKDFRWKYGKPPLQNQDAINRAREWWENTFTKKNSGTGD